MGWLMSGEKSVDAASGVATIVSRIVKKRTPFEEVLVSRSAGLRASRRWSRRPNGG
ncbi:hypothetical protein C7S13_2292 [Burkholderia cepacia]|nr:hypothetical protein [Burkholderia cepacia]